MSTYNICFRGETRKILCGYPLLSVAIYVVFSEQAKMAYMYDLECILLMSTFTV